MVADMRGTTDTIRDPKVQSALWHGVGLRISKCFRAQTTITQRGLTLLDNYSPMRPDGKRTHDVCFAVDDPRWYT